MRVLCVCSCFSHLDGGNLTQVLNRTRRCKSKSRPSPGSGTLPTCARTHTHTHRQLYLHLHLPGQTQILVWSVSEIGNVLFCLHMVTVFISQNTTTTLKAAQHCRFNKNELNTKRWPFLLHALAVLYCPQYFCSFYLFFCGS